MSKGSFADHMLLFQPYLLHLHWNVFLLLLTTTSLPKLWEASVCIRSHSAGRLFPQRLRESSTRKEKYRQRETRRLLDLILVGPFQLGNSMISWFCAERMYIALGRNAASPWWCCCLTCSAHRTTEPRKNVRGCFGNRWQRVWVSFSDLPTLRGKHVKNRKISAF